MFTYWLYGNKQMFDNKVDNIKSQGELALSHHTFAEMHNNKGSITNSSENALIYTMFIIAFYLMIERLYIIYKKTMEEKTIDS